MPVGVIAGIGVVVAGVGTYEQIKYQQRQAKEAKKANKFQRQMSELQSARQRIDAVRQGRQAQAVAMQQSANQGAEGSSIGQGGAASIYSQTASNLSFLGQYGFFSDQATEALQRSANAGAKSSLWGSIAGIGKEIYSASGGISFKGPPPPKAAA